MFTGLVAATGKLAARTARGPGARLALVAVFEEAPFSLGESIAVERSITVDGVSLTVKAARGDEFEVMIIAHTLGKTKLGDLSPGDPVNLEVDLIARYVARLMSFER